MRKEGWYKGQPAPQPVEPAALHGRSPWRHALTPLLERSHLILALVILAAAAAGSFAVRGYEREIIAERQRQLALVASLECDHLAQHLAESARSGELFQRDPEFGRRVAHWLKAGATDGAEALALRARLTAIRVALGYRSIELLDGAGRVILQDGARRSDSADPETAALIARAQRLNRTQISDMYPAHAPEGWLAVDVAAPLDAGGVEGIPAPVVRATVLASSTVAPEIVPSAARGALLPVAMARRDGNRVLILTYEPAAGKIALRHALLESPHLVAAMAARGAEGVSAGIDNEGKPIIAAIGAVPGSTWKVIAAERREDVAIPLQRRATLVLAIALSLVAFPGFLLLQRQRRQELANAHLAAIVENSNDAIITRDLDGIITSWNAGATRMLGYAPEEAVSRRIDFARPAGEPRRYAGNTERLMRGEILPPRRSVQMAKDGTLVDVLVSISPLRNPATGAMTGVSVIFRDISPLTRVEASLRDARDRLQLAVQSAGIGFWDWDLATDRVSYSDEWKAQLGYAPGEIEDARIAWQRLCHPDDLDATYAIVQRCVTDSVTQYDAEFRLRHRDGSYRWIMSRAAIYRDAQGRAVRVIGGDLDITGRTQAEEKASRLGRFYAALTETNEALVRNTQRQVLFERICDIAIARGGLRLAWIGLADARRGRVHPVAVAGSAAGYLDGVWDTLDPELRDGKGAAATALRTGKPQIVNDLEANPPTRGNAERARRYGIRSAVAFPLTEGGRAIGTLNLYAGEARFFGEDLVQLLHQMADDISYALDHLARDEQRRAAEQQVRESEARHRLLVQHFPQGVVLLFDRDMRYQIADGPALPHSGFTTEDLVGRTIHEALPADYCAVLAPLYQRALEGETTDLNLSLDRRDWAGQVLPVRDDAGAIVAGLVIVQDITDKKRAEEQARLAARAFENIADGVMICDAALRIVSVNNAFTGITGYAPHEVLGATPRILSSGRHDQSFYTGMWREIVEAGHWQGEIWNRRKSGEVYPELLSVSAVKDNDGRVTHYVGVFNDISRFKEYEARLEYLAHHDVLTTLPNRALLGDRVDVAVSRRARYGGRLALLFIDLDRFKLINDSLGHDIGDSLLQEVAERLHRAVRACDTVSRHGGDEFLVLITEIAEAEDAARIAETLMREIARPYRIDGHTLVISASIGIAVSPENGDELASLLRNSDAAMYAAKEQGRDRYHFYSEAMHSRAAERLTLEHELRCALEGRELALAYQPQIDLASGAVVGVEALARWRHPQLGDVPPTRFIAVAEDSGLILAIGDWVLRAACLQSLGWLRDGLIDVPIAVNVSAIQFRQSDFSQRVLGALAETGLPPEKLELEVTETAVMQGTDAVIDKLAEISRHGLRLAIDDFGTGYSSLGSLRNLPLHRLKIDQCFVRDLPSSKDATAITQAIISMGRSLGLDVVAEGIETSAQAEFLQSAGCESGQGYLYCKPVPADEFEAWLRRRKGAR